MGIFDLLRRKPQAIAKPEVATEPDVRPLPADTACPHCGFTFESAPKRKRNCPSCGKPIVVRRGRLVTEAQAEKLDEYGRWEFWAKIEEQRITMEGEPEPIARFDGLPEKDGRVATMRDVPWNLLTQRAEEALQRDDVEAFGRWRLLQARRLFEEGKPHFKLRCESALANLLVMQSEPDSGPSARLEIWAGGCCKVCNVNDEKKMTIATALKTLPIPNERCQKGWCTCVWG